MQALRIKVRTFGIVQDETAANQLVKKSQVAPVVKRDRAEEHQRRQFRYKQQTLGTIVEEDEFQIEDEEMYTHRNQGTMNLHEIELLVRQRDPNQNANGSDSEGSNDDEFQVHPQHLIMPSIDNHRDPVYRANVHRLQEIDNWNDVSQNGSMYNANNSSDAMISAAQTALR